MSTLTLERSAGSGNGLFLPDKKPNNGLILPFSLNTPRFSENGHRESLANPIKRILFIEPKSGYSTGFNDTVRVETLGPEYLAEAANGVGIESKLLDLRTNRGQAWGLDGAMSEVDPQVVAIKCGYTTDVPEVIKLAKQIKKMDPKMPVIVGGHHASLSPSDLFSPYIDGIITGQAEEVFPIALKQIEKTGSVEGVPYTFWREDDGTWQTTAQPRKILNTILHNSAAMNERPEPDRTLSDPYRDEYYFLYHDKPYTLETARGCRYRCSFCSVWQFNEGGYQVEGWQRTFDEIQKIPDGSYVNIVDDLAVQVMPNEKAWASDSWQLAMELWKSDNKRRFWMQCRADNIVRNKALYATWAEAGLDMVLIGLESDDPEELKRVNKGSKVNVNDEAVNFLHALNVKVWGAQIVFNEWQKPRFDHLIDYNKRMNMDTPQFTIHTPLPGTVDWKRYHDQLVTRDRRYFDFLHPVLPTELPIREFVEEYIRLYRECHMPKEELDRMVAAGEVSEAGARRYLRQYISLLRPRTYADSIALHDEYDRQGRKHHVSLPEAA